jgi:cytochrome c biogenesis protein CcmG/thiol:disulfide interchange protein DsbE
VRRLALIGVLLAVAVALAYGNRHQAPSPAASLAPLRAAAALEPCPTGVGDVPDLTLPCLGGGPSVRLRGNPSGLPTLVNVYGSWCAPCQAEMPLLASFAHKAHGKVALLGVDTEDDHRLALLFARDVGQHWPAVIDDSGVLLRHYSPGPPVTLFVAPDGKVTFVQRGRFASVAALEVAVRQHLGVRL